MQIESFKIAGADIWAAIRRYPLVAILGWQDVRQRYRRSLLGPFWLTLSMSIMIASIGLVFGHIFESPMREFLPFLATGIIFWNFVSASTMEGSTGFIVAEGIIKQLPIPFFVHILRVIWRNLIILAHNIVILPIVFLIFGKTINAGALLAIPGLLLVLLNVMWMALILAVLGARYRDLPQLVTSVLQVFFYLTPISWMPAYLSNTKIAYLMIFNPYFHLFQIIRAPLLGEAPTATNWLVAVTLALCGWLVATAVYGRYKRRITYWL